MKCVWIVLVGFFFGGGDFLPRGVVCFTVKGAGVQALVSVMPFNDTKLTTCTVYETIVCGTEPEAENSRI